MEKERYSNEKNSNKSSFFFKSKFKKLLPFKKNKNSEFTENSKVNIIYKNYMECLNEKIKDYKSLTNNDQKKTKIYEITHSHPMTFDQFSRIDSILRTTQPVSDADFSPILNSINNIGNILKEKLPTVSSPVGSSSMSSSSMPKGFNPLVLLPSFPSFKSSGQSGDASSSSWWNPLSWGGKKGNSNSSSGSWNPLRKERFTIPKGRLPKAEWPKNEEQYGVVIPEHRYKDVSAPVGSVVAPAFVAMQTFFSRNVSLIIMCVLLLIAVALLIAGLYLNIREQHKKESDAKEQKHHLFSSTQSAIRLDNQTNTQQETVEKLQKKKLAIGIRVQAKKKKSQSLFSG